ncbi:hypothetical protein ACFW04_013783 [Cataglyphis niger]
MPPYLSNSANILSFIGALLFFNEPISSFISSRRFFFQSLFYIHHQTNRYLLGPDWQSCASGEISRFKARLCAQGFLQKAGLNYHETFSPVVRYDSLRVLLALVAYEDLEIVQFDIKTAFLYGELDEEIYIKIPEGLEENSKISGHVCKLQKVALSRPRDAGTTFKTFLRQFNFIEGNADKCMLFEKIENYNVYLAFFVDDSLIAAKSRHILDKIIEALQSSYKLMVGDANLFVGLQIERNRKEKSMFLHQRAI